MAFRHKTTTNSLHRFPGVHRPLVTVWKHREMKWAGPDSTHRGQSSCSASVAERTSDASEQMGVGWQFCFVRWPPSSFFQWPAVLKVRGEAHHTGREIHPHPGECRRGHSLHVTELILGFQPLMREKTQNVSYIDFFLNIQLTCLP